MVFESYFALFVAAFLTSLSHCIPMCGGIALGLNMRFFNPDSIKDYKKDSKQDSKDLNSKQDSSELNHKIDSNDIESTNPHANETSKNPNFLNKNIESNTQDSITFTQKSSKINNIKITQILANIIYFCGRSLSYIAIGLAFSLITIKVGFSDKAHAIMLIILGVLLLFFAFFATFLPKFLSLNFNNFNLKTPSNANSSLFRFYKNAFKAALKKRSFSSFFVVGILNGLLPCHLVYMFALSAASSATLGESLLIMLLFCIATFPALFSVGIFATSLLQSRLKGLFMQLAFIIMCFFALNNIYKGATFFTTPQDSIESNSHHHHHH